jgi:dCMP deaminase
MNALMQAAKLGHAVNGATAYCTNMACTTCAKALIAAGIRRVVVCTEFHDTLATYFYKKAGVTIEKQKIPSKEINYQIESYSSIRGKDTNVVDDSDRLGA